MEEHTERFEAIAELQDAVNEINRVSVPEVTVTDEMLMEEPLGDDWYDLSKDEEWWEAWSELYEIMSDLRGQTRVAEDNIQPDVEQQRQYEEVVTKGEWTSLSVKVYADGSLKVLAEYDAGENGAWYTLYDQLVEDSDSLSERTEPAAL